MCDVRMRRLTDHRCFGLGCRCFSLVLVNNKLLTNLGVSASDSSSRSTHFARIRGGPTEMEAWKGVFRVDPGKKAESPCLATAFPGDVNVTGKLGHLRHHHGDRMVSSVGNRCLDTSVWLDFSQQEFQVACYAGVSCIIGLPELITRH